MSKSVAFAAAMALACWAAPAAAGVVITQEQTVTAGQRTRTSHQTITIQGHKQKIEDERHTVIVDLDSGKQLVMVPATKTYFETPLGPRGRMGPMMPPARGGALDFKKTGKTRTVAGFKCDDYEASGQSMSGEYATTECLSKGAPGAADLAAFQKAMTEKLKGRAPEMKGLPEDSIPLASDSTIKIQRHMRQGMGKQQGGAMGQEEGGGGHAMHERPPVVIHTVVTKIERKDIAPGAFEVPSEYKLGGTMQQGAAAGPGATAASPGAAPSAAAKSSDDD
jgi:hypothetical protein